MCLFGCGNQNNNGVDDHILLDDSNCYYYNFENGKAVKYDPSNGYYYVYDINKGWEVSFRPAEWMHDNNLYFEEVYTPNKGRKLWTKIFQFGL